MHKLLKVLLGIILVFILLGGGYFLYRRSARPSPPRMILLGFDGLDNLLLDRLIAEGKLPNFQTLREEGAWGDLRTIQPMLSPIVWTSVTTGRHPETHWIFHFFEEDEKGKMRPASSLGRRAPAFWNIAPHYGVRCGAVGWYSSWPAELVENSFLITNQISTYPVDNPPEEPMGLTYPPELELELMERFAPPKQSDEALSVFLNPPFDDLSEESRAAVRHFYTHLAVVNFQRAATPYLVERFRPELLGVYFKFPDALSHLFADYSPPPLPGLPEEDIRAFGEAVDRCYVFLDGIVGEFMAMMGEHTTLVICSDHGFRGGDRRPLVSAKAKENPVAWHRLDGVVMLYGGGVKRGHRISEASIYDIAPTTLYLSGIPLSKELKGGVIWEALDVSDRENAPTVADYADVPREKVTTEVQTDIDAMREELQALGYIGGGEGDEGGDPRGKERTLWRINRGTILFHDEEWDKALAVFRGVLKLDPSSATAHQFMGMIERKQGDLAAAKEYLAEALELKPDNVTACLEIAEIHETQKEDAEALAVLQSGVDAVPHTSKLRYRLAMAHARLGRLDEAVQELEAGVSYAEDDEEASSFYNMLGVFHGGRGRHGKAEAALLEALRLYPGYYKYHANLGILYRRMEDFEKALEQFREAEQASPDNVAVLNELGRTALEAGKISEAAAYFERSLAKAPQQPEIRALLSQTAP